MASGDQRLAPIEREQQQAEYDQDHTPRSHPKITSTVARLAISGEMYGVIATLLAGRGSILTPIAAPIAYGPIQMIESPSFGQISPR